MNYRPEIDGLRAVAVTAVLLFHLGFQSIPAGFVGVDIFFVISGYLITSILMRDLELDRFSLAHFYRRRVLRILPPLVVVLAVTIGLALLVMLPSELRQSLQAALASLLFVSNIFFWSSFDYFTPNAKENPLLHTWSLGVEEQFYIIVPLILWLCFRYVRRLLVPVFAVTVLLSFALSVWAVQVAPTATFYLLPTRYWELGVGSLLALLGPRLQLQGAVAQGVGFLGAGLIVIGVFGLSDQSLFPGAAALWPVLGAAFLIAAGGSSISGRLLAHPFPVWIGRISYSLYLWHWPLIVLYKLRFGPVLGLVATLGLLLASVAFATLSYHLVEKPFRTMPWRISDRRVLTVTTTALGALGAVILVLQANVDRLRNYPDGIAALDRYATYRQEPAFVQDSSRDICFITSSTPDQAEAFDRQACMPAAPAGERRPTLLLLGDSLMAHLRGAIERARPDLRIQQATASGCRPFVRGTGNRDCLEIMNEVLFEWIPDDPPEMVVISARWRPGEEDLMRETMTHLRQIGVGRIIVLGPTVHYQSDLPDLLARDILNGVETASLLTERDRWEVNATLSQAVTEEGGIYVDLLAILCPESRCQTRTPDGVPMQFDYGHYTTQGADWVAERFVSLF